MNKSGENNNDTILDGEISINNIESIFSDTSFSNSEEDIIEPSEEETIENEEEEESNSNESFIGVKKEETKKIESPINEEDDLEEEEKVDDIVETSSYYSTAKSLIDSGFLEDIRISVSEEDEEGTPLSEFKNLTESQLNHIIESQKSKTKEDLDNNYFSKDGFTEHQLKVIDIMKNGGDIKEIFKDPSELIERPFENLDLSNEDNQKRLILHFYMNEKGLSQKEAVIQLQQKEKDLEVDSFSTQIKSAYDKAYDAYLENTKEVQKQKSLEEKQKLSDKRKSLSSALKNQKIKDSLVLKIVDGATKPIEGKMVQAQKRLQEILDKPEENYEVLLHLLDEKSFKELYKIQSKKETTKEVLRIVDSIPSKTTKREKE